MNVLDNFFQTDLLKVILQDRSFVKKYRDIINSEIFDDNFEKEIINIVIKFFDKYKIVPSRKSIERLINCDNSYDQISYLYDPIVDINFITDEFINYMKKTSVKKALLDGMELLQKGKINNVYDTIKKAVIKYDHIDNIGISFWDDKRNILDRFNNNDDVIPTGIKGIDSNLDGGPIRGTLNIFVTPPNKGKTTTLVNIGKYAALSGFKVVHYTLELSESLVSRRYFMSMVRMTKKELRTKKRTAYDNILKLADKITSDSIIIKQFPTGKATIRNIDSHLNKLYNNDGFIPDVIIIDYPDLIKSINHYEERRHEISEVYYALRALGNERNSVIWGASQTNRPGNKEDIVTIDDLAECWDKAASSDVIISVNQTLQEKRSKPQLARMFISKSRDDESGISTYVETDWSCAWIGDYYD